MVVVVVVVVVVVEPALGPLALLPPEPALAPLLVPLPAADAFAPDAPLLVGEAVLSVPAGVTFVAVSELEQLPKKHALAMRNDPSAHSGAGLTLVSWFMAYLATSLAFITRDACRKRGGKGRLASHKRLVHGQAVCASHSCRQ
jgi:hypothetical protein